MLTGIYTTTQSHSAAAALLEGLRRCEAQAAARNLDYWRGEVEDFAHVMVEDADGRGRGVHDAYQARGIVVVGFVWQPPSPSNTDAPQLGFAAGDGEPVYLSLDEARRGEGLREWLGLPGLSGDNPPALPPAGHIPPPPDVPDVPDGLDDLDVAQLRALAKERGVNVPGRAGADRLRAILREADTTPKP